MQVILIDWHTRIFIYHLANKGTVVPSLYATFCERVHKRFGYDCKQQCCFQLLSVICSKKYSIFFAIPLQIEI